MKRRWLLVVAAILLFLGVGDSFAQLPPLIPREILFGNPERTNPQISSDGKILAYLAPDKENRLQIWLRIFGKEDDRQLTVEKGHGIQHYTWTYDGEHLIFAQDTDGDENWHIHAVNMNSGVVRNLTPFKGVQTFVVAIDPNFPHEMLIAMNLRNRRFHDAYRINLKTGETILDTRSGGFQFWWVPDSEFKVRAVSNLAGVIVRDADRRPWRMLRRWQLGEPARLIGFSKDGKSVYVRGIADRDSGDIGGLLAVDIASGKETVIAQEAKYDVDDVFVHPITREIQAVAVYKEKLEWQVLDQSIAEDFAVLAKIQRGELTVIHPPYESLILPSRSLGRRDLQDKTWIVSYGNHDGSIYHYAYDRASKTAALLFSERPKLEGLKLANMQPISYESRDGLTIHGYLTLPVGIPAKNLPAVLLVHGGPWLRDRWGYYDTVQWLANRGYAVLQVNYRGSTGYGRKFYMAGFKEWGGKMHDDLIDGVQWMVKEGIADPKRIAIMGGSYGGYAALVGLTFTSEIFAAGISRVGISNLLSVTKTRPPYWAPFRGLDARRVGDPEKEEEFLKSRSPLFFADRIKAPLLIAHGKNDVRVVVAESDQMVEAMRKANKAVEYVAYDDEGHQLRRSENKFHFYAKAEEFLAKHLGGRFEAASEVKGHSGVAR